MKKRNPITLVTGAVLALIFLFMLFSFQVRKTQVAVVTTFGKFSHSITNAGFNVRWPFPIQKVYKFDNRIRNFERKFEETYTKDGRILMCTVFLGWRIADPKIYLERFEGDEHLAEQNLENLVRDTKNGVIGRHAFGDLISPDPKALKFNQIEKEMLDIVRPDALKSYGIDVVLLGIKQLGLPQSITTKVFDRMKEERQRLVKQYNGEGEAKALQIRADADRQRADILTKANAQATKIRGEGDAQAAKSYAAFEKHPDLAVFLLQLKAIEQSLTNRTTLILDPRFAPFDLLTGITTGFSNRPAPPLSTHTPAASPASH